MPDAADPLEEAFDGVDAYAVLVNQPYPPFERSARVPCKVITLSDGKPSLSAPIDLELTIPPTTGCLIRLAHNDKQIIWQPFPRAVIEAGAIITASAREDLL